jgi:hypothetical protein
MPETITMGALTLNFLRSKDETGGSLDMFEMIAQPNGRMPVPHYHESWDETIYGLSGTTMWRVDGKDIAVTPGETVFIPRPRLQQQFGSAGLMPVHADARRARPRLFPRDRRNAWRRCARSGQDEGDHAAPRLDSGASGLSKSRPENRLRACRQ